MYKGYKKCCRLHKVLKLEWIVLLFFLILSIVVSVNHEPWFDEAQAWQIAKCASIRDILIKIPHYEGHPPLWYLILAIPAKSGVSIEIGLKTVGLLISMATVSILLFCSRLPRPVRLLIPFTYFVFFQYGVIVRPYGIMLILMILLGMTYSERDRYPWKIFILLAILCLTSAYGIILAGGISICIVWDIWRGKGTNAFCKELLSDPRTRSLILLLIVAILQIIEIFPSVDTYSPLVVATEQNSVFLRLVCALLTFPGECLLTSSSWFGEDRQFFATVDIPITELTMFCIIGVVIWLIIMCSSSKKGIKLILVPYSLFAVFSSLVYFSGHHLGITVALLLFWAEVLARDENRFEIGRLVIRKFKVISRDERLLKGVYLATVTMAIIVNLVWTGIASIRDLCETYSYGRDIAIFLREKKLSDKLILSDWYIEGSSYPQSKKDENYINTYMIAAPVPINAYFTNNVALNLNNGDEKAAFVFHRVADYEKFRSDIETWKARGIPELLFGNPNLEVIYKGEVTSRDYSLVYTAQENHIWKTSVTSSTFPVYVRNDLLNRFGLTPMEKQGFEYLMEGLSITDEMREQYENGASMEEILQPYLDLMFGES